MKLCLLYTTFFVAKDTQNWASDGELLNNKTQQGWMENRLGRRSNLIVKEVLSVHSNGALP